MTNKVVTNESILAEITRLFTESNMVRVDPMRYLETWPKGSAAFEDEYSIIAIWAFDSVASLVSNWGRAQDAVIEFLGATIVNTDPKSWDGYLVLVSLDGIPDDLVADVARIRSDTRRVRKLIITGDDLPRSVSDALEVTPHIRRALAPVLDLNVDPGNGRLDPLDLLSSRLSSYPNAVAYIPAMVDAFESGMSTLEVLHRLLGASHETGFTA